MEIKINEIVSGFKLEIISIANVFGESMKRIVEGTSLSSLFISDMESFKASLMISMSFLVIVANDFICDFLIN